MTPTVGQIRRELAILRESKIKAGVNPNVALNDARRQMNQKYGYKWRSGVIEPKFTCYEYWRPNIPDNGCIDQCKECKELESPKNINKS